MESHVVTAHLKICLKALKICYNLSNHSKDLYKAHNTCEHLSTHLFKLSFLFPFGHVILYLHIHLLSEFN